MAPAKRARGDRVRPKRDAFLQAGGGGQGVQAIGGGRDVASRREARRARAARRRRARGPERDVHRGPVLPRRRRVAARVRAPRRRPVGRPTAAEGSGGGGGGGDVEPRRARRGSPRAGVHRRAGDADVEQIVRHRGVRARVRERGDAREGEHARRRGGGRRRRRGRAATGTGRRARGSFSRVSAGRWGSGWCSRCRWGTSR